jgi:hypothetical protein
MDGTMDMDGIVRSSILVPLTSAVVCTALKVLSLYRSSLHGSKECGDYSWIELSASAMFNFLYGLRDGHCRPIWPI